MRVFTNLEDKELKLLKDIQGETFVHWEHPFKHDSDSLFIRDSIQSALSELDKADKIVLDFGKTKLTYFFLGYFIAKLFEEDSHINILRRLNYKNLDEDIKLHRLFTIQFDKKAYTSFSKMNSINVNSITNSIPFMDIDIVDFIDSISPKNVLTFDIDLGFMNENGLISLGILFYELHRSRFALNIICSAINEVSIALSTILPIAYNGEFISEKLIAKLFAEKPEVEETSSKTKGKQMNEVLDNFGLHQETDIVHIDLKA